MIAAHTADSRDLADQLLEMVNHALRAEMAAR